MSTVSEEIDHAHHLGKDLGRHRQASDAMLSIAGRPEVDEQTRAQAYQQAGVYALNAGQLNKGYRYLRQALDMAINDQTRGNIKRDMARYYFLNRNYPAAIGRCDEALRLHADSEAAIMDRSFRGRALFEWGYREAGESWRQHNGLRTMHEVDQQLAALEGEDYRRLELYNKLHLISALSRVGDPGIRQMRDKCAELAQNYGNPQHRMRVKALIIGGWRGEWVAMRLLKSAQRARNLLARLKH